MAEAPPAGDSTEAPPPDDPRPGGDASSSRQSSEGENMEGGDAVRKLQKIDSGIDVEKSPSASTKDGLSSDCGDSVSEGCVDSAGFSLSHSESVHSDDSPAPSPSGIPEASFEDLQDSSDVSPNEGSAAAASRSLFPDLADLEAGGGVGEEGESPVRDSNDSWSIGEDEDDDNDVGANYFDDTFSDEDEEADGDGGAAQRKRRHESVLSSTDSEEEASKSAQEEEKAADLKPWPRHKWRAIHDLRRREIGSTNRTPPSVFREKVQGSLQMVQRLKLQYKMEYHEGCVNALHFNRIGTLLASGSDDLQIVLWNWVRNRRALIYESGHRSNVFQAKFMPFSGDCHVVSCARDGQVRLAELSLTGVCKSTKKLAQHKGAAHKLALELGSPHVFLSCGEDAVTYQIDLREDRSHKLVVTKENEAKVALYSIHSNPVNSYQFCTGGRDHYIRIYDKRKINEEVNGGIVKKYCPQHLENSSMKANVTCASFSYNGTEILGSYNDEDIYLFDASNSDGSSYTHRFTGHRNNATVKGVNFYGPRSEYIVSGSDCGHVFLWDKETERVVQFLEADQCGVVNVLEPHPFAPVLATSGLDHDVKVWAPSAHDATRMEGLNKQRRKNRDDRKNDRFQEPEMIDGQMLWFIMHHFRRSARRRLRQEGEEVSSSSDNSDSESEEEGAANGGVDRMQCQTS